MTGFLNGGTWLWMGGAVTSLLNGGGWMLLGDADAVVGLLSKTFIFLINVTVTDH